MAQQPLNKQPLNRVLITRFSAIGDVAMSIPVVYSVARSNPSVEFVYVTRRSMVSLFVNRPDNLQVVGIDLKEYPGLAGLRRLYHELAGTWHPDAYADLHGVLRTYYLALRFRASGIKVARINKGRSRKRALTRRHNKVMLPLVSQRARYREVFYSLGLTVEEHFSSLFGDGKGDPSAFAEVTAPKREGEQWVGIAPFAKHRGKIYPPELMHRVIGLLLGSRPDLKIFLFGGGDEEERVLSEWARRWPDNIVSLAGKKLGFDRELALLSHLDVMVSMDSANMHLASIVAVPTVSIWGATHPYCGFKGWKQQDRDIVQLSLTCRPCSVFGNKPCQRGDYLCLNGIPPRHVADKVLDRLLLRQMHPTLR